MILDIEGATVSQRIFGHVARCVELILLAGFVGDPVGAGADRRVRPDQVRCPGRVLPEKFLLSLTKSPETEQRIIWRLYVAI